MESLVQHTTSPLFTFIYSNTTGSNNSSGLTTDFNVTTLHPDQGNFTFYSSVLTTDFNVTTLHPDQGNFTFYSPFNNPWNVISAAMSEKLIQIIDFVYVLFLAVGVPANVINCLVFYRQVGRC